MALRYWNFGASQEEQDPEELLHILIELLQAPD